MPSASQALTINKISNLHSKLKYTNPSLEQIITINFSIAQEYWQLATEQQSLPIDYIQQELWISDAIKYSKHAVYLIIQNSGAHKFASSEAEVFCHTMIANMSRRYYSELSGLFDILRKVYQQEQCNNKLITIAQNEINIIDANHNDQTQTSYNTLTLPEWQKQFSPGIHKKIDLFFNIGSTYMQEHNYTDAFYALRSSAQHIRWLKRTLGENTTYQIDLASNFVHLASLFEKQNNLSKAVDCLHHATLLIKGSEVEPDSPDASLANLAFGYYELGIAYIDQKLYQRGLKHLTIAYESFNRLPLTAPDISGILRKYAKNLESNGDHETALEFFRYAKRMSREMNITPVMQVIFEQIESRLHYIVRDIDEVPMGEKVTIFLDPTTYLPNHLKQYCEQKLKGHKVELGTEPLSLTLPHELYRQIHRQELQKNAACI